MLYVICDMLLHYTTYIKELKAKLGLGDIIQLWTILLPLGSLQRSSAILKPIFFVVLLTLEKLLTWFLGKTFGIGWKR
jgi:hypothetical protein